MKICVAGAAGAFGIKHLDALAAIAGVEVVSVVGGKAADIEALAAKRAIPHADKSLDQALARRDVEAVILSTPTKMHAAQAIACLKAGKHVLVEIPMADSLAGSEALRDLIREQVNSGQKKIVLNLGGIAYMDSSGLGELVTGMKAVRQSGGDLKLLNLTKKINDILQITRLYSVFDIYKDETQALASFRA